MGEDSWWALKQIGMTVLAETLATQQCLGGTLTSSTQGLTPNLPLSPAKTSPEASCPQASESSSINSSLYPVACPLSPSSPSDKVSRIRAEIDQLVLCFSALMSDAQAEMSVKESKDPSYLTKVIDDLLGLSVAKKVPHSKFFTKVKMISLW